jgi:hypothetical protein
VEGGAGQLRPGVLDLDLAVAVGLPLLDRRAGGQAQAVRGQGRLGGDRQDQPVAVSLQRIDAKVERSAPEQRPRFLTGNLRSRERVDQPGWGDARCGRRFIGRDRRRTVALPVEQPGQVLMFHGLI